MRTVRPVSEIMFNIRPVDDVRSASEVKAHSFKQMSQDTVPSSRELSVG